MVLHEFKSRPRFVQGCLVSWFMILVNFVIQFGMLLKLDGSVKADHIEFEKTLFQVSGHGEPGRYPSGVCWHFMPEELSLSVQKTELVSTLDCTPDVVVEAARGFDLLLGQDNDGKWTLAEAQKLKNLEADNFLDMTRPNMPLLFSHWMEYFVNVDKKTGNTAYSTATWEFNCVTGELWENIRHLLQLCTILNPRLCGNLDLLEILPVFLPHKKSSAERIAYCEGLVTTVCPTLGGEHYKFLQTRYWVSARTTTRISSEPRAGLPYALWTSG